MLQQVTRSKEVTRTKDVKSTGKSYLRLPLYITIGSPVACLFASTTFCLDLLASWLLVSHYPGRTFNRSTSIFRGQRLGLKRRRDIRLFTSIQVWTRVCICIVSIHDTLIDKTLRTVTTVTTTTYTSIKKKPCRWETL
jgi:hypothetical protein